MRSSRYAILLDGGFVIKKLGQKHRRFPDANDIEQLCLEIQSHTALQEFELLRNYFYHAPPASGKIKNPLSGMTTDLHNSGLWEKRQPSEGPGVEAQLRIATWRHRDPWWRAQGLWTRMAADEASI